MELAEVFDKLTQQVSMCLEDPLLLNNGLVMLNKTNFGYFSKEQQSELFRLKGLFFERLGDVNKAQESFAKGMCISDDSGEGWLSWAQFYDRLLHIACNEVLIEEKSMMEMQWKWIKRMEKVTMTRSRKRCNSLTRF